MLNKVEVRTSQGNLMVLSLEEVVDGLFIEEIEGLDPVKATMASSDFAGKDGAQYQSSWRETRNITLKLVFDPDDDETVQDVRLRVYDIFEPTEEVELRFFMEGGLTVNILARVETCAAPMWGEEPGADISLLCFDPDFVSVTTQTQAGATVLPTAPTTERMLLNYKGSVPVGVVFEIQPNRSVAEFTIYHTLPNGQVQTMEFSGEPLVAADVVYINTIEGQKGATLFRSAAEKSVLYAIPPQAAWFNLKKGDNYFRVEAAGGSPVWYAITWTARYGGL
jgi:hypothetical protein